MKQQKMECKARKIARGKGLSWLDVYRTLVAIHGAPSK
jgi:hypothetical protein